MGPALEQKNNNVLQTVSRNRHCLFFSTAVLTVETQVSSASPSGRPSQRRRRKELGDQRGRTFDTQCSGLKGRY